ncbi:hypothetical protein BASA62_001052 [Batrachochytrium salamandrivorans]|nr:hypothetical protein BASA62_001052 [Batrachochytrium salamandrivorans]
MTMNDAELDELLEKATASLTQRKNQELQEIKKAQESLPVSIGTKVAVKPAVKSAIVLGSGLVTPQLQPYITEPLGNSKYTAVKLQPHLQIEFVEQNPHVHAVGQASSHVQTSATGAAETIHIQPMKTTSPPELELSAKEKKKMEKVTAGPGWFGMVSTDLTDQVKQDLHIIRSRGALDPKRHYKRDNSKVLPKVFQFGTIIEGPTEFYSSRLTIKERKQTIVDELLTDAKTKAYMKRKTLEINEKKNNFTRRKDKMMMNQLFQSTDNPNNSTWVNSRGSWIATIVVIFIMRVGLAVVPGISTEASWTLTNLGYNAITFVMFHWISGVPYSINQNEYDGLTLWEQIDGGAQFTPTKKYLTAVPIILFLLSTHYTHYDFPTFMVNLTSLVIVLVAKLPSMHQVRLFGVNEIIHEE